MNKENPQLNNATRREIERIFDKEISRSHNREYGYAC